MDLTEDMFDAAFIQVDPGVYEDHGLSSDSDSDDYNMVDEDNAPSKCDSNDGSSETDDSTADSTSSISENQNEEKFKISTTSSCLNGTKLLRAEVRLTPLSLSTINHAQKRQNFDLSDGSSSERNNASSRNNEGNFLKTLVDTNKTEDSSLSNNETNVEKNINGIDATDASVSLHDGTQVQKKIVAVDDTDNFSVCLKIVSDEACESSTGKSDERLDKEASSMLEKESLIMPSEIKSLQSINRDVSKETSKDTIKAQNAESDLSIKEEEASDMKNCSSSNDHPYSMPTRDNTNNEDDESDNENALCIDEVEETNFLESSDETDHKKNAPGTVEHQRVSIVTISNSIECPAKPEITSTKSNDQLASETLKTDLKLETDCKTESTSSENIDGEENFSNDEKTTVELNELAMSADDHKLTLYGESDTAIVNCRLLCVKCIESSKNDVKCEKEKVSRHITVKESDCESCKDRQQSDNKRKNLEGISKGTGLDTSRELYLEKTVQNSPMPSNLDNVIEDVARNFSNNALIADCKDKKSCESILEEALVKLAKNSKPKKKNNVIFLKSNPNQMGGKPVLSNSNSIIIKDDKMKHAIENAYKNVKTTETAEIDGKIYKVIIFSKSVTPTKTSITNSTSFSAKMTNEMILKNASQGNQNLPTIGRCVQVASASPKMHVTSVTTATNFNVPSKTNVATTVTAANTKVSPTSSNQNLIKIMSSPPLLPLSSTTSASTPNKAVLPHLAPKSATSLQSNTESRYHPPIKKGISLLSLMKSDANKPKECKTASDAQKNVNYGRVSLESAEESVTNSSEGVNNKFINITDFFTQKHSGESGPVISATFSLAPEIETSKTVTGSFSTNSPSLKLSKSFSVSNLEGSQGKRNFNRLNSFNDTNSAFATKRLRSSEEERSVKTCVATRDFLDDASKKSILSAVLLPPFTPVVPDSVYDAFNPPARFRCLECPDTFTSSDHLLTHSNRRSALMKYNCPFCQSQKQPLIFYNRCMLKQHCKMHNVEVDLKHLTIELLPLSQFDFSIFNTPESASCKSDVSFLDAPIIIPSCENTSSAPDKTLKKPTKKRSRSTRKKNETQSAEVAAEDITPCNNQKVFNFKIEDLNLKGLKNEKSIEMSSVNKHATTPCKNQKVFNFKIEDLNLKGSKNEKSIEMSSVNLHATNDTFTSAHHALEFFEKTEACKKSSSQLNGETEDGVVKSCNTKITESDSSSSNFVKDKTTANLTSLNRPSSSMTGAKTTFLCSECNTEYLSLSHHFQNSGKPRSEVTCECGKVLTSPCSLKAHNRLHYEKPPYTCPECGETFTSLPILEEHLRKSCFHSCKKSSYKCLKCDQNFAALRSLEWHILKSHTTRINFCGVCEISNSDSAIVSDHLKREHADSAQLDSYKVLRFLKCDFCPSKKFSRQQCRKHIQSHTSHRSSFTMNYYYHCSVCKDFKTISKLNFAQHFDLCSFSTVLESLTGDQDTRNSNVYSTEAESTEPKKSVFSDNANECVQGEIPSDRDCSMDNMMNLVPDGKHLNLKSKTELSQVDHNSSDLKNCLETTNCDHVVTVVGGKQSAEDAKLEDPTESLHPSPSKSNEGNGDHAVVDGKRSAENTKLEDPDQICQPSPTKLNEKNAGKACKLISQMVQCKHCLKKFGSTKAVSRHLKRQHAELIATAVSPALKRKKIEENLIEKKKSLSVLNLKTVGNICTKQTSDINDDSLQNFNVEEEHSIHRSHNCSKCSFVGLTYKDLFNHMETHKTIYECLECGKSFVVRPSLEKHLVLNHNFSADAVKTYIKANNLCPEVLKENGAYHAQQGFYQCATCYKNFASEDLFSQHFRSHGMAYVNDSLVSNLANC